MAKKKSKNKFGIVSIIMLAVLLVSLVMAIVGLCIDWLNASVKLGIGDYAHTETTAFKIGDLTENSDGFKTVEAFAIIAVICAASIIVCLIANKFVGGKALKFVSIVLSVLLIVSALICLILTYTVPGDNNFSNSIGGVASVEAKYAAAAGCWLLSVFGLLGGVAGVVGAVKN